MIHHDSFMKTQGIPTDLTFKRHLLPWGLRALLLGMVLLWSLPATAAITYQQIKSFGPSPDQMGETPFSSLLEGNDGALYGTTFSGGSGGLAGGGTVFKVNKDGTGYTVLYSFGSVVGDGWNPAASLTEGSDGVLYGTTISGGSAGSFGGLFGGGTVFKVNKDGTGYAILHSFGSLVGDGLNPSASLIEGNDGVLYGTAANGGSAVGFAGGTVFKVNKDGSDYATLHSFASVDYDGLNPVASLTEGSDGALYGTARQGGSASEGALFKMNKDGTGYAILHSFRSVVSDGYRPLAGLIEGNDGALYGTTSVDDDGDSTKGGTVFKVNKDGTGYAILYRFSRTGGDGAYPQASLTEGNDGALHGMTYKGGSAGKGTLFKVNKDGTGYAVLRGFGGSVGDGQIPYANLTLGSDGVLYGTTTGGGSAERGTIFKVNEDGTGYAILRSFITLGICRT